MGGSSSKKRATKRASEFGASTKLVESWKRKYKLKDEQIEMYLEAFANGSTKNHILEKDFVHSLHTVKFL